MNTLLITSSTLAWWFIGLVSTQLLWRELPEFRSSLKYELGPFVYVLLFLISLTGLVPVYFYLSRITANKIEEGRARKQFREAMQDEKNRLVLEYHEKLLEENGLSDIAKFDPSDAEIQ